MTAFAGLKSLLGSQSIANALFVLISVLGICFVTAVTTQTYEAIMARMFLEARRYESVPVNRLAFLARARRWLRVSWALFLTALFEALWTITIVGGVIKHFSYKMVPYLLAENPELGALEAITLSRKMMDGHKWEAFKLELSFIGWYFLGALTLGITELLFSGMYQQAAFAEYYAYVRACAKERGVPGTEKLLDSYLFEQAPRELLDAAYADIGELEQQLAASVPPQRTGAAGFFANAFGVVLLSFALLAGSSLGQSFNTLLVMTGLSGHSFTSSTVEYMLASRAVVLVACVLFSTSLYARVGRWLRKRYPLTAKIGAVASNLLLLMLTLSVML